MCHVMCPGRGWGWGAWKLLHEINESTCTITWTSFSHPASLSCTARKVTTTMYIVAHFIFHLHSLGQTWLSMLCRVSCGRRQCRQWPLARGGVRDIRYGFWNMCLPAQPLHLHPCSLTQTWLYMPCQVYWGQHQHRQRPLARGGVKPGFWDMPLLASQDARTCPSERYCVNKGWAFPLRSCTQDVHFRHSACRAQKFIPTLVRLWRAYLL